MGFLDSIKSKIGGGAANIDSLKQQAAGMKDQVDGLVDQYGDKLPDSVKNTYDKVSDKADDLLPSDDPETDVAAPNAVTDANEQAATDMIDGAQNASGNSADLDPNPAD